MELNSTFASCDNVVSEGNMLSVTTGKSLIVIESAAVQPYLSVTVSAYVPAANPEIVLEDC
jgi:hypothetical protein